MGIEQRLENWARTVRDPLTQPQCCASWAKLATALRDAEKGIAAEPSIPKDVQDGWLVERAWQKINDPIAKRLLQYYYVHQFPPEIVCRILVRKFGASPHTLKHWKVRLAKAHSIAAHVIDGEVAREEMAAAVKRMQQPVAV
ncbi:hypothetical protein ACI2VP_05160 [Ralstonia nicotianae]